ARASAIDAALRRAQARRLAIESRYYDTPDRRLAETGLSLRLRRSAGLWEQTLKAPGAGLGERLEETALRPGRWGPEGPPLDPSLHDGTAAGKRLRALLDPGGAAPAGLEPVHTCVVVRRRIEIEAHGGRVEVAFDRGEIHAGSGLAPVCELEYELKGGDAAALIAFGKDGVRTQGLWLSTLSKAARGDRLGRGAASGPPVKAKAPMLDRSMTGADIVRAVLKACLDQVLANASELAEGHRTAESIHQLRVGIRRARTAWRELAPLCPVSGPDWETPLADAFRALGAYRDRNTVVASLQARLAESGSPEPTLSSAQSEPPDPVEVVRATAFQCALLDAMALTLPGPSAPVAAGRGTALDFVASRLERLHKQLKRAARNFAASTPTEQHQARKRLKRLRYLGELTGSLYKPQRVERYLGRLSPAQDALGAHIDLLVGLEMARASAEGGDAQAWFNVGWLTAQLDASARRCDRALGRAARAEPFWKR
ncbi:MAG: CHAD domain-containing protein, partial [Caldimonas sp.]